MKNILFCLITLLFFVFNSHAAKTKTIKIKGDKSVSFFYDKDSSILAHRENKKLVQTFYLFYKTLKEDNYEGFLNLLSPNTLEKLPKQKFERKYKKLREYAVNLVGKINIVSIYNFERSTLETDSVYVCMIKLPEGQKIASRTGFDPLARIKTDGIENYLGMTLVKSKVGYRIVIRN